jgi:CRP-like cAMP-binding protein
MIASEHSKYSNLLLRHMTAADLASLECHFERVSLPLGTKLEVANKPVEQVYFFESGLASVVAATADQKEIEVGIAGREGMSGPAVILGASQSPHKTFMQVSGMGHRIPVGPFGRALQASPTLLGLLLRYVQTTHVQTASTALANGRAKLEERLARWLLMTHDRMDGNEVTLTHDFLAVMLGVRRPGVTEAIHILEGKGLIRAYRGRLFVTNRDGLLTHANGFYGAAEREYERLMQDQAEQLP